MLEWLSDPTVWLGLVTLVVLEIVPGIDNLIGWRIDEVVARLESSAR